MLGYMILLCLCNDLFVFTFDNKFIFKLYKITLDKC